MLGKLEIWPKCKQLGYWLHDKISKDLGNVIMYIGRVLSQINFIYWIKIDDFLYFSNIYIRRDNNVMQNAAQTT